ncbi:hypothetical protein H6F67_06145 [Microcoleus sp. FACHB-1515]|uniref:hypothetical protein n=1 Tax=Cyanophyceae TaxID=3028117 RepID=UPI001689C009|nr:hypothetical protein [Microcoleus sp. FACHB-1515]MBD2089431.1 hypothetical protein [Microcoleus sp. FACHB-1515]
MNFLQSKLAGAIENHEPKPYGSAYQASTSFKFDSRKNSLGSVFYPDDLATEISLIRDFLAGWENDPVMLAAVQTQI